MIFEILSSSGEVENTIVASREFVEQRYPGMYREVPASSSASPLPSDIDRERDRRINAGFIFDGVLYQSRPDDRENIAGAVLIAIADPAYTTGWIAADNSVVQMDAPTLLRFGRTAADHKQALIFAARQLKDMQPIPQDYTDDKWWPAA